MKERFAVVAGQANRGASPMSQEWEVVQPIRGECGLYTMVFEKPVISEQKNRFASTQGFAALGLTAISEKMEQIGALYRNRIEF